MVLRPVLFGHSELVVLSAGIIIPHKDVSSHTCERLTWQSFVHGDISMAVQVQTRYIMDDVIVKWLEVSSIVELDTVCSCKICFIRFHIQAC